MEEIFCPRRVQELLATDFLGRNLIYEETVDSTNLRARALAELGAPQGSVCCAEQQKAGRGRRGRSWHTPRGEALAMSFLLYPEILPEQASMLSLVAGFSTVQALEELGVSTQVKWPNDVVLHGKKICGILTEMQLQGDRIRWVVTGIGLNINVQALPPELAETGTSLLLETGRTWEREQIMAAILNHMEENYRFFCADRDLSRLREAYEACLVNKNRQVRIEAGADSFTGVALGITDTGELQVHRDDTGETETIGAGEVSVRGLYGYV